MVAYQIFDSYSGNDDYAAAGLWLPRSGPPAEFADGRTLDDVRIFRTVAAVATGVESVCSQNRLPLNLADSDPSKSSLARTRPISTLLNHAS